MSGGSLIAHLYATILGLKMIIHQRFIRILVIVVVNMGMFSIGKLGTLKFHHSADATENGRDRE